MKVQIEEIGTVQGYEDYHNALWVNDGFIGESHYDKRQRKHVAIIKMNGKVKKFYHDTPEGIRRTVEKWLNT